MLVNYMYANYLLFIHSINPSVKISENVAKVYLVHLKVKHCQTLHVLSIFTGQNESIVFDW